MTLLYSVHGTKLSVQVLMPQFFITQVTFMQSYGILSNRMCMPDVDSNSGLKINRQAINIGYYKVE